jgi:aminopeptidase N
MRMNSFHTILLCCAMAVIGTAGAAESRPGQLPTGVVPVHYDIRVEPDAEALIFVGQVGIDLEVQRATPTITLNALDIEISRATLDGSRAATVAFDRAMQTTTLTFDEPVAPGRHRLEIDYTGRIQTTATGLFAVDYDTPGGARRMLTTQFEVADARRFAPMWDEPSAKATFALEVVLPGEQSAYSNMPVAAEGIEGGKRRIRFANSPRMSSYLLHLSTGELERISRTVAGVDVGVVTRKGASESGRQALEAAAEVLPWFNDYFGTPYPLPKLDMIAVPGSSQFFGAMENWGAIMYFEPYLLVDPRLSSESDRQLVFATVAHEVAHQWFGNLVTMDWWDDLWLNEGFATWMEAKAERALHPERDTGLQVVNGIRESALRSDASSATHPVVQPVPTVEAASQAFDAIAYSKGSAVIHMLEDALGEAGFRAGIRRYLAKYAYTNAATDQLWTELAAATGQPVVDIAHDFTLQPGVPLVSVSTGACANGRTMVTLSQGRFETGPKSARNVTWRIPVHLRSHRSDAVTSALLEKNGAPLTVSVDGCGPVIVNAGHAGYFRVRYTEMDSLALRAVFDDLAEIDRLGILNDAWALGEAGEVPITNYLELAAAIGSDSHPFIVIQLARTLVSIDRLLDGSGVQAEWRAYARQRLRPTFERIGWLSVDGEAEAVALLRETLIRALGRLDDPDVIAEARARFAGGAKMPEALPAAIHRPVQDTVALHADRDAWNEIRDRAKAASGPVERQRLLLALGAARDPALAARTLELALTQEVPTTFAANLIAAVSSEHPELAFEFAVVHEGAVLDRVEASSRWAFIPMLPANSADAAMAEKVQAYVERSVPPDARQAAAVAMAEIRFRAGVKARQQPALEAWMRRAAADGLPRS